MARASVVGGRLGSMPMGDADPVTCARARTDWFEAAVEAVPRGLLVIEADGSISLVNREAERLFGRAREELLGRKFEALLPGLAEIPHADAPLNPGAMPEPRANVDYETWLQRPDLSTLPVLVAIAQFGGSDAPARLALIADITVRKRALEALKAKSEELARSNEDLEQFAYLASHDLQEPLRMVASYTQLLSDKYQGQLDDQADRYIRYAVDGAKRMQTLVRDLLSYSRVTASRKPPQQVDPQLLITDILRIFEPTIMAVNGVVVVEHLPVVIADAAQLHHLFSNLIGNALKFRRADAPRVRISSTVAGRTAFFCVEDNGIGIDPRHFGRIFQMFQQLNQRDQYEGSGIGLAIVKKIVERHCGRVWVESEMDRGTKVHFTLPGAVPG